MSSAQISQQGRLIVYLLATFVACNFLMQQRQQLAAERFAETQQDDRRSIVETGRTIDGGLYDAGETSAKSP